VRNRRKHPRAHQEAVVRRKRRQSVTRDEDGAELQQRPLARLRRGERDDDRSAAGHADRIAADQETHLRNAGPEAGGDVGEQADDGEFGRPDSESR